MPDRGLLERTGIEAAPLSGERAPWTFSDARWAQLTFEVSQPAALAHLPADAARPVPCYARLFILDAAASPAGPIKLAALLTGGRFRMLPRNVLTDAIVDGPVAAVAAAFGSPFRAGRVTLTRTGQVVEATVADGDSLLATLTLPALRAVDPAMLRWDAWLGFAAEGADVQLIEYTPEARPTEAFLSKNGELDTPSTLARTHLWRTFRNLNTISACYEEGTLTLSAPETQQSIT
ncbi:MAG: hypothetical protein ACKVT1_11080 [Dehalococcoidia bacterium]